MLRRPDRRLPAAALLAGALVLIVACTPTGDAGGPTSAAPSQSATPAPSVPVTPTPTPSPTGPAMVPDGTAADNLGLFSQIVDVVWASPDNASGRAYIDALVTAGFDKTAMQVTNDTSTVGNRAESLQFSVLWGDECLVGQVGPATGDPVTVVLPELPDGGCLVGDTRPIDW